jgi:hypothetical protein
MKVIKMPDFFYRTEDIKPDEVLEYFVETAQDRKILDALKGRNPVVLIGSRGVGKSFLLRVAQAELLNEYDKHKAFPVYVTFNKSSLIQTANQDQFKYWMIARLCAGLIRQLWKQGKLTPTPSSASMLAGGDISQTLNKLKIEEIAEKFEESWKTPNSIIDTSFLPSIDTFKEALEDLAEALEINRFIFLIDEAAHIFLPEQQRQFFTLFRDLRNHIVTCNAAVYPGVTSYGETFQPIHDATMLSVDRDILDKDYISNMREIVEKQADSSILKNMEQNGQNFAILAYAATGNPRILLKTVTRAEKLSGTQIDEIIREYYRSDVWSEHSNLAEKYSGHATLINWGRNFIEREVIPDLKNKNDQYLTAEKNTTAYIWLHRDAPEVVKEALRVLAYTGIVIEHATGIKATRSEIGTRYQVNLGCLFAQESSPRVTAFQIATNLTPRRMAEFGSNHPAFKAITTINIIDSTINSSATLKLQLNKSIDVLDLSLWTKSRLRELGLLTVGDVFNASEEKLKQAYYVGNIRARRMRNTAVEAVIEYLSG